MITCKECQTLLVEWKNATEAYSAAVRAISNSAVGTSMHREALARARGCSKLSRGARGRFEAHTAEAHSAAHPTEMAMAAGEAQSVAG